MNEFGTRLVMTDPPVVLLVMLPCFNVGEVSARRVSWTALAVVTHDVLEIFVKMALLWLVISK